MGYAFAAVVVALLAAAAVVLASSGSSSAPQPQPVAAAPLPAAAGPECDALATSTEDINSALSHASPGEIVCVADGTYPELDLSGEFPGGGVEVRAENPGAATIEGATISGQGITFARFFVDGEIVIEPESKEITIAHDRITGGYLGIDACNSDTATCDDVKIVGNKLEGPYGEDAIRANRYHDANGDGVGLLVEGNEFTGIREDGNHSDCLQAVWTGDNLVFRKNYLHDNRCQGFFVKDQADLCAQGVEGVCGPIDGIRVEDNLLVRNHEPCEPGTEGGCGQPIYLHIFGPYKNAVIAHNTIWGDHLDSQLALREGVAAGTKIEDNAIYRFWTDTDASKAEFRDNTLCRLEGEWPESRPGMQVDCKPPFQDPSVDDYRLPDGRGVDWAPAEEHYGP
ncbi:MAG: right-handed parallel beta-helix repeat-containing protein [Actinobacteria bacterium]|nr:right-handed parallel beta-helix repeat-containing protein [Actinomycetota bacterium]